LTAHLTRSGRCTGAPAPERSRHARRPHRPHHGAPREAGAADLRGVRRRRAMQHSQTAEDAAASGRAARAAVPRSLHGAWQPAADRPDPVAVLEAQAASRVPELVPIRYGRMLVSPFTFFRGGAALMAADLAPEPRTGLDTQLCGDAHLSNFGAF